MIADQVVDGDRNVLVSSDEELNLLYEEVEVVQIETGELVLVPFGNPRED